MEQRELDGTVVQALDLTRLRDERTHQLTTFDLAHQTKWVTVPRGQRVTIGGVDGRGYISHLWLTFPGWFWQHWAPDAAISPTILKTLILRIFWDGATRPAVEAPVGDFFGNGLCEAPTFTSRYFGMSSGGFYCSFPMPFANGFRIEFENLDANVDADLFLKAIYQLSEDVPVDAAYFHAQFRTSRNPGGEPIEILDTRGRGHYVGCTLSMQAEERNYLSYLEAPEYVFIDDDGATPSFVGTGLEDYFLGGWYFREGPFAGDVHGVPSKNVFDSSVAMYRVHTADAIRFRSNVRFAFVNPWPTERLKPFAWSAVAFLYLDRPEGDQRSPMSADELLCWYRIRDTDHLSVP
jgi:hypothetical protein